MRTISPRAARLAAFLGILSTAACDSPVNPLDAQEASTQAMLAQILDKLDTIEERIDSLEATLTESGSVEVTLAGVPALQLDSLMELASWIAADAASGSAELCGKLGAALDFGLELGGEAEGKGVGSLGAWAGTGAFAGAEVKAKGALGGSLKFEGEGGIEFCAPVGGDAPPTRAAAGGPARSPELDQLRTTLTDFTAQLGISTTKLGQSLTGVRTAIQSPGSVGLQNLGGNLPLPSALAGLASDPLGSAASRLQTLSASAQSALCTSSNWGSNISTVISQACGIINSGGMANFTVLADIANSYPAVETAISTVCTRVNSIGLQRLIIPSWDVTFPLGIGTVNVFPGYNQRLFANYTSVACP